MRIWVDNTGLHAAGRCLNGTAKNLIDVEGIVQFGTFLATGKSIHLNGFEHPDIFSFSEETKDEIVELSSSKLEIIQEPSVNYRRACLDAAYRCANDFSNGIDLGNPAISDLKPSKVPNKEMLSQITFAREVMKGSEKFNFTEIADSALSKKAVGAFEFMLSSSKELREAFRTVFLSQTSWTNDEIYALTSACRMYLNEELSKYAAKGNGAVPGLAVARARIVVKQNGYSVSTLDDSFKRWIINATQRPLPVPPLAALLVQRSKGDPRALLVEALSMRENMVKTVGEYYSRINTFEWNTVGRDSQEDALAREISAAIARKLKREPSKKFPFGMSLQLAVAWVAIKLNLSRSNIQEWAEEKFANQRWKAFSEMAEKVPKELYETDSWRKLVDNSMKNLE